MVGVSNTKTDRANKVQARIGFLPRIVLAFVNMLADPQNGILASLALPAKRHARPPDITPRTRPRKDSDFDPKSSRLLDHTFGPASVPPLKGPQRVAACPGARFGQSVCILFIRTSRLLFRAFFVLPT